MHTVTVGDEFTRPHFERSALVFIDVQKDFLDGGASAITGTTERLPFMKQLVIGYRKAGLPIIHVIRLYQGDDVDTVRRQALTSGAVDAVRPGTEGAKIPSSLLDGIDAKLDAGLLLSGSPQTLGRNEVALWKPRWSAFYRTSLDEHLRGLDVDTVVIAGCNFPNCPRATIFDASGRDYRVVMVEDAISGATADRLIDLAAIGAHPMTTASVLAELPPTASNEHTR